MRQLFLPHHTPSNELTLQGKNYHYIVRVLRLRNGDECTLVFEGGETFQAVVSRISSKNCTLEVGKKIDRPSIGTGITLIQALPKGKKMDQIVRQAAECGVASIIPVETEYSQIQTNPGDFPKKIERWNRIIKEALQQSGSSVITRIEPPRPLETIPAPSEKDTVGLFFHQCILELKPLHGYLSICPNTIYVCIGAEGGFSPAEIDVLKQRGFFPVYLGEQVLRTETAVVYALGAVKTLLQEIHSWVLKK